MYVQERTRKLVEDENRSVVIAKWPLFTLARSHSWPGNCTHESKPKDTQCSNRMTPNADPKDPYIACTNDQIPKKISTRKTLYQSASTCIAVHPLYNIVAHLCALVVREHDP